MGSQAPGRPGLEIRIMAHASESIQVLDKAATAGPRALLPSEWGMAAFLLSEASLFATLITVYLSYIGKERVSPTPHEALSFPVVLMSTACLLASSVTVHLATGRLHFVGKQAQGNAASAPGNFFLWWSATVGLGVLFLVGTAFEWRELIVDRNLTISRNLFGTTFYTLVGFHAAHVTAGVIVLSIIGISIWSHRDEHNSGLTNAAEIASWYWHFVDGVWIVVFLVVYVLGR